MAARFLPSVSLAASRTISRSLLRNGNATARTFSSSSRLLAEPVIVPAVRKPVGAFRGGLLGFLTGATTAGAGLYYYVVDEYKVSNELLTEDIYALQAAVQRIESYVQNLEEKVTELKK